MHSRQLAVLSSYSASSDSCNSSYPNRITSGSKPPIDLLLVASSKSSYKSLPKVSITTWSELVITCARICSQHSHSCASFDASRRCHASARCNIGIWCIVDVFFQFCFWNRVLSAQEIYDCFSQGVSNEYYKSE